MGNAVAIKPVSKEAQPKLFYAEKTGMALRSCLRSKHRPLSMPELIEERMKAPNDSQLWTNWLTSTSIRATGKTPAGIPIVLYVHTDNSFSNPARITAAIKKGLVYGAGAVSLREFRRLLKLGENGETDATGNRLVHVVDHKVLIASPSKRVSFEAALEHPQTIPFIGSEERAKQYLARSKEVYGRDKFGVFHHDDLKGDQPLGRLLYVGNSSLLYDSGLYGDNLLNDIGRFVGVPVEQELKSNPAMLQTKRIDSKLEELRKLMGADSLEKLSELIKLYTGQ